MARAPHAAARPLRRALLAAVTVGALAALAAGCASRRAADSDPWSASEVVGYRLLTQADFQASSSSGVWGNVAHGAEICTRMVPVEGAGATDAFRAVMSPRCSFWNETLGPLATLGGLAGASVVPGLGTQQPDWYVLQHEQIHFAIMEVEARQLSRSLAELTPQRRTPQAVQRAWSNAIARASQRNANFDAATSGTFDPQKLDLWVSALEKEMRSLCGRAPQCWVRHRTPMGWGR